MSQWLLFACAAGYWIVCNQYWSIALMSCGRSTFYLTHFIRLLCFYTFYLFLGHAVLVAARKKRRRWLHIDIWSDKSHCICLLLYTCIRIHWIWFTTSFSVCEPFTYGLNCMKRCKNCRYGKACNSITGVCSAGCKPGWSGENCDKGLYGYFSSKRTTNYCFANLFSLSKSMTFFSFFVVFSACPFGTYGVDCVMQCGKCRKNETCHSVTGLCNGQCVNGWKGDKCDERRYKVKSMCLWALSVTFGAITWKAKWL